MINSDSGTDSGQIDFDQDEVLVGLTLHCNSESDKRPRRFGFTKMRTSSSGAQPQMSNAAAMNAGSSLPPVGGAGGFMIHETRPEGNNFRFA